MNDFIFQNPTKILFGKESINKLNDELKTYGKKVMLIIGKGSIKDNGIYNRVIEKLKGYKIEEFSGIEQNPRVETINLALEKAREFKPDFLLAIGGGSVIDATKLISASYYYNGNPWNIVLNPSYISKAIPFGVILTVAATGSEMNCYAVITNWGKNLKATFESNMIYPKFSILNPEFTMSLSSIQTAYGIVDAYSHVLEQYINTTKDALIQDRWAESILQTLIEIGPKLIKNLNNYNLRAELMFSATMALNGFISMGVSQDWATHNIEHELSAFYDIPHGAGLAIITPRWMQVVSEQKKFKLSQYGKRVWNIKGDDNEVIIEAIAKTYEFFNSLGLIMNLKKWNIDNKYFEEMASRNENKIGEIKLTKEQILLILNNSL